MSLTPVPRPRPTPSLGSASVGPACWANACPPMTVANAPPDTPAPITLSKNVRLLKFDTDGPRFRPNKANITVSRPRGAVKQRQPERCCQGNFGSLRFGQFGTSRSGEKCSKFRERRVGSLPSELAVTAKNSTTVTNCGFNLTAPMISLTSNDMTATGAEIRCCLTLGSAARAVAGQGDIGL